MGFKSVLKMIGEDALKGVEFAGKAVAVEEGLAPFIGGFMPARTADAIQHQMYAVQSDLAKITGIIAQVEKVSAAAGGKDSLGNATQALTGQQKFQAAMPDVAQLILAGYEALGMVPGDPDLVAKGMAQITQGSVDVFNGMKKKT